MTLSIAWVGPWNTRSAIAKFGAFVVGELAARGHAVTVFRSEVGESLGVPAMPAPGAVLPLPAAAADFPAERFDGVIANIGNSFEYHGALIRLVQQVPCLGIFHDGFLAHLAAGWDAHHFHATSAAALRRLVHGLYGPDAWPDGTPYWGDQATVAATRPMTEWLAHYCAGIVTHSQTWVPRLREACAGDVCVLPLAYPDTGAPASRPIGRRLVVATIGHVNPNKLPGAILRAIGHDPLLRQRCEYRLLGPIEATERDSIGRLARSLDLPPPRCTGWIDDEALAAAVAEVDVIACLRNPVLEGGSASLVLAMYSARPTLVSDHGVYGEVPKHLLLPCTPGQEEPDVARHLRGILADPAAAKAMGQDARAFALETHSASRYVDGLLPALAAATAAAPAVQAAVSLGRILGGFGLRPGDPSIERLAGVLRSTIGGNLPASPPPQGVEPAATPDPMIPR